MSQGTPIGDLTGGMNMPMGLHTDEDIVNRIKADMNLPMDGSSMNNIPPAPSARTMQHTMMNDPNPSTMIHHTMDNGPATSHMIGGQHPSGAEFSALLPGHMGGSSAMAANAAFYNTPVMQPQIQYIQAPSQSWFSSFTGVNIFREMKIPIFVAILFAFMSLPVVNAMIGHYLPSLLKVGGDLTSSGLVFKSLLAGTVFWILQRVLVPLVAP